MNRTILVALTFFPLFILGQDQQELLADEFDEVEHTIIQYSKEADSLFNKQYLSLALPIYLRIDSLSKQNNFENLETIKAILRRAEISKTTFTKESSEIAYELGIEALERAMKTNLTEGVHCSYVKLADYCQLTKRYDDAKEYVDKALQYYLQKKTINSEEEGWISRLYLIESAYYLEQDSAVKGKQSRYKAVSFLEGKNNDSEMAKAKYYYGHYLRDNEKDYVRAMVFLEDSKTLHQKIGKTDIELFHRCLRDLAICNDVLGNHEKSKTYYKQAYNLKIELNKKANRNTSRRLETKYQIEKKEQEIQLLTSQKQLAEQQKKSQRNILFGGIGITGLAGLFLFILFRNRKRTTDKLKELDHAKSKFFANISHEFRTPLTLIANPIEEVLEDMALSDKKREQFKMAKRNSDRLLSLVNQLLDLSKIDAGQLNLRIQKGNLTQLIAALAESFTYNAEQKQIDYSVTIAPTDQAVYYDKDAIEKMVVNLVSNAIKYTPKVGFVVCSAQIKDAHLILDVKNTGKGLTEAELKNIFQRFYQTSEDNVGTGIGLALVKELVDLHKGTISVDSKPDSWTSFTITLPVDKNSFKNEQFVETQETEVNIAPTLDHEDSEADDQFADSNLPILLIVEDNQDIRTLLRNTFESDYKVMTAEHGEAGIESALEHIPDIIISDIMMPVKDGIELTKTLKNDERTSHIPIVLLTAKAGDANELKGIETGADDYITKPFSSKILTTKVAKLIEMRQKLQSRYSQELVLLPKDIAVSSLDEEFLEKVQTVLDEKLVESSFSIDDFSKAVGMSRMQLHRKIKAITGLSAGDFIRSQRLKLAAQLLKNSDINVSQVGYTVGFNDHSYFTKRFKEAYHCTPTAYAKKHT